MGFEVKRVIYFLCGVSASLLMAFCVCSDSFAVSYQLDNAQKIVWNASKSKAYTNGFAQSYDILIRDELAVIRAVDYPHGVHLKYFRLAVTNELKKGQIVSLNYSATVPFSKVLIDDFNKPYFGFACDSSCFVLDQKTNSSGIFRYQSTNNTSTGAYEYSGTIWLYLLDSDKDTTITLIADDVEGITFRGGLIADTVNISASVDNVNDSIQQGNQAEQDRYDEAKNEADQSKNDSQTSSEDSQSKADSDSASLWEIINTFKDTVTQSQPGNCNIPGDFGFFDAGSIDICSGGNAFRPITTVVGTVMLVLFTFGSALTLVNAFLQLYNESLRS